MLALSLLPLRDCQNAVMRTLRLFMLLAMLLLASGCDGGPQRAPVSGKVLLDGKPLNTGTVIFVPQGGGLTAKGDIESDGSFRLRTDGEYDGAVLGSHYASVRAFESSGNYVPNYGGGDIGSKKSSDSGELVPAHYMDPTTSGLAYEVNSGDNVFTIELSSKR